MHFYKADGSPMHTIIGKNGAERTTSIRDARELSLYPSVTTILDNQAKPALIAWFERELLTIAADTPYYPWEYVDKEEWKAKTTSKLRQKSLQAAEKGTLIHNMFDVFFKTGEAHIMSIGYIEQAIDLIDQTWGLDGWVSEQSFCSLTEGFAGCVDLYHPELGIIIDFKTKEKDKIKSIQQFDDYKLQLAAYQVGLGMPISTRRFNLFVSTHTNTIGECSLVECEDFTRPIKMFLALRDFWILKHKYDPRIIND